jgi:hypothetical protein
MPRAPRCGVWMSRNELSLGSKEARSPRASLCRWSAQNGVGSPGTEIAVRRQLPVERGQALAETSLIDSTRIRATSSRNDSIPWRLTPCPSKPA